MKLSLLFFLSIFLLPFGLANELPRIPRKALHQEVKNQGKPFGASPLEKLLLECYVEKYVTLRLELFEDIEEKEKKGIERKLRYIREAVHKIDLASLTSYKRILLEQVNERHSNAVSTERKIRHRKKYLKELVF